jgi:hypothetical protein
MLWRDGSVGSVALKETSSAASGRKPRPPRGSGETKDATCTYRIQGRLGLACILYPGFVAQIFCGGLRDDGIIA